MFIGPKTSKTASDLNWLETNKVKNERYLIFWIDLPY